MKACYLLAIAIAPFIASTLAAPTASADVKVNARDDGFPGHGHDHDNGNCRGMMHNTKERRDDKKGYDDHDGGYKRHGGQGGYDHGYKGKDDYYDGGYKGHGGHGGYDYGYKGKGYDGKKGGHRHNKYNDYGKKDY